jgi:tRNA dimethylallyltransferase
MKNPIIVLTGPTASGKTKMSFELAKKFGGEIICADSMTVYTGMDIGTDKPTLALKPEDRVKKPNGTFEINGVTHHLLDILEPNEEFNAAIFKEKVSAIITEIQSRGKIPFLVGGSLLYIDSLVYDYQMPQVDPDPDLREELEKKESDELFSELVALDPDAEWTIDKNNRRRVIRALEVCLKSGEAFTAQKSKKELPENVLYLAVCREREELYQKINKRVDEMMSEGFLEETQGLYKKYDHSTAMQATGYRQLLQYIEGEVSLDEAVEQTKKSHRNFAKRQLTWLRRNTDTHWINSESKAESEIEKFLK